MQVSSEFNILQHGGVATLKAISPQRKHPDLNTQFSALREVFFFHNSESLVELGIVILNISKSLP